MAGKKSVRLQTIGDCSQELSKLYNKLNRDQITIPKTRALGYILNLKLNVLRDSDIENRLKILEEKLKAFENPENKMRVAK